LRARLFSDRKEDYAATMTTQKETEAAPVKKAPVESQARVIKKIRERVEQKLSESDVKVTLADYIRLVQLEKELEEDEPREIKVTWVNPEKTDSDSGK
jgi:hypothetical protein